MNPSIALRLILCLASSLLVTASLGQPLEGLHAWMQQQVDEGSVIGCSAQVTKGGETIFLEAFGDRTPESNDDLTIGQIVRIYSMTKAIVSAATMQLVEEGKVGIDDPVSMYIPEFAEMSVGIGEDARPARRQITIRDLLTHTSGLGYDFSVPLEFKPAYKQVFVSGGDLETAAASMGLLPLFSDPGSGFVYGVSIDVLGRVIEVASGQSLGEYLQAHIFAPLQMMDTSFTPPDDLAHMHIVTGSPGTLQVDADHYNAKQVRSLKPRFQSGGGGLWSTLHDYTRFMQAMERYGELDGARILKAKTVAFMTQNQLSPAFKSGQRFGLGFGLEPGVATSKGLRGEGRWAWGGAACTYFFIDPSQDLTAIYVTQKFPFDAVSNANFHKVVLEAVAVEPLTQGDASR